MMEVPSPPTAPAACNLLYLTMPPAWLSILHRLAPDGSVNLNKYWLYSASLSTRAQWHMSNSMDLVDGGGESISLLPGKSNNAALMKKTHAKKCVYGQSGTDDDPIEHIKQEQSLWYQMYVVNYFLLEENLL
jgi:hypothetical protein